MVVIIDMRTMLILVFAFGDLNHLIRGIFVPRLDRKQTRKKIASEIQHMVENSTS